MSRVALCSLVVVTTALAASSAQAISSYRARVPNGNEFSCQTCHVSASGGRTAGWNPFGKDVLRQDPEVTEDDLATASTQNANYAGQQPTWDAALCGADSDGDGQTNGQELGDPDCVWTFTTPATPPPRSGSLSRPGDSTSTSDDPDGVDVAEGEGEGEEGEGEGEEGEGEGDGGEEGEGEGEAPGCCSAGNVASPIGGLIGLLALRRRRR